MINTYRKYYPVLDYYWSGSAGTVNWDTNTTRWNTGSYSATPTLTWPGGSKPYNVYLSGAAGTVQISSASVYLNQLRQKTSNSSYTISALSTYKLNFLDTPSPVIDVPAGSSLSITAPVAVDNNTDPVWFTGGGTLTISNASNQFPGKLYITSGSLVSTAVGNIFGTGSDSGVIFGTYAANSGVYGSNPVTASMQTAITAKTIIFNRDTRLTMTAGGSSAATIRPIGRPVVTMPGAGGYYRLGVLTGSSGDALIWSATGGGTFDLNPGSSAANSNADLVIRNGTLGTNTVSLADRNIGSGTIWLGDPDVAPTSAPGVVMPLGGLNTISSFVQIARNTTFTGNSNTVSLTKGTGITNSPTVSNGATTFSAIYLNGLQLTGSLTVGAGTYIASSIASMGQGAITTSVGSITIGASTHSGGVSVVGGSYSMAHATSLGTGPLRISGGTIGTTAAGVISGHSSTVIAGSFTNGGTQGWSLGAGNVTLTANSTITTTQDLTIPGYISGTYSITKAGAGTLTLGGNNTISGIGGVNAGTLRLTGNSTFSSGITIAAGAVLALSSSAGGQVIDVSPTISNASNTPAYMLLETPLGLPPPNTPIYVYAGTNIGYIVNKTGAAITVSNPISGTVNGVNGMQLVVSSSNSPNAEVTLTGGINMVGSPYSVIAAESGSYCKITGQIGPSTITAALGTTFNSAQWNRMTGQVTLSGNNIQKSTTIDNVGAGGTTIVLSSSTGLGQTNGAFVGSNASATLATNLDLGGLSPSQSISVGSYTSNKLLNTIMYISGSSYQNINTTAAAGTGLSFVTGCKITVNPVGGTPDAGTYPLFTYAAGSTATTGSITLVNNTGRTGSLTLNTTTRQLSLTLNP